MLCTSSPALGAMQNSDGLDFQLLVRQLKDVTENLGRAYDQSKPKPATCVFYF